MLKKERLKGFLPKSLNNKDLMQGIKKFKKNKSAQQGITTSWLVKLVITLVVGGLFFWFLIMMVSNTT